MGQHPVVDLDQWALEITETRSCLILIFERKTRIDDY
jgi:hypothetical protein